MEDRSEELAEKRTGLSVERTDMARLRTHLSNQRTLLAWIRTSISLIGFGFGVSKYLLYIQDSLEAAILPQGRSFDALIVTGFLMIGIGIIIVLFAFYAYKKADKLIGEKSVPYNRMLLIIVLCIAAGGILTVYDLLLNLQ